MKVILEGKFIANETKVNRKTGEAINYAIVLTGNETVRIKNCTMNDVKKFDDVHASVELVAVDGKIYCSYSA